LNRKVAFYVALGFVVTSALFLGAMRLIRPNEGSPRPEIGPRQGFGIAVDRAPFGNPKIIHIGADGSGCQEIADEPSVSESCVIATFLAGPYIAEQAKGRINSGDVPAKDAAAWRAWLSHDPAICAQAGLSDTPLVECETSASGSEFKVVLESAHLTLIRDE
jgi:hypothetical protein